MSAAKLRCLGAFEDARQSLLQGTFNNADLLQIEFYRKYKEEGLLADLSDIIKDIGFPKEFASKDFDAVAVEHTLRATSYNTKKVSHADVPRTWEDLLDPKWKGKIALEINMGVFINLTNTWGEEKIIAYLEKLGKQNPIFTKGASFTMTLLGAGEFPLAVNILLHRIISNQVRGMPVDMVPISPIVDRFAPFVIIRNAPHPNVAKLYLR
ncbi:ABC transporter substrate-binding protein [Thermodesulfobacteriota bacterium]